MRRWLFAGVALAGCSSGPTFTVGGQELTVRDQQYLTRPEGYFCDGLARNQIKIVFDDYAPACKLDQSGSDPRDPTKQHAQLELVLSLGGNPNLGLPFTFDGTVDCALGGASAIALFKIYPANEAVTPATTIKASSGTIKIDSYDKSHEKPLRGTYDLVFDGANVKGNLDALNCDT